MSGREVDGLDDGGDGVRVGDLAVPDDDVHQLDVRVVAGVGEVSDVVQLHAAARVVETEDCPEVLQRCVLVGLHSDNLHGERTDTNYRSLPHPPPPSFSLPHSPRRPPFLGMEQGGILPWANMINKQIQLVINLDAVQSPGRGKRHRG